MKDFKVYQASGYLTKLVTDASDVRKEYEDISGSLVQFDTPISAPLASLIVDINPVQAGSGDPAPDNVRPITGWMAGQIWVKSQYDPTLPATASVTFPDTVYGGTYDFVSGVGSDDCFLADLGDYNWMKDLNRTGVFYATIQNRKTSSNVVACTEYKVRNTGVLTSYDMYISGVSSYSAAAIFIRDTRFSEYTGAQVKEALEGVKAVLYRATPTEIQLAPQEINTLFGVNNIWADTGDVSVKYRTH